MYYLLSSGYSRVLSNNLANKNNKDILLNLCRNFNYFSQVDTTFRENKDVSHVEQAFNKKSATSRNNPNLEKKLIYEGKLSKRILYLKSVSILSSVALASSYSYVISQKSFSVALAGVGFVFTPFLVSPIVIAWFFKRYITQLYYNPLDDTYTAHHYGLLLNKKSCTYKKEQVIRSEVTSMLNTFTVDSKPFFLWEDDLIDVESVNLYKRMIGLSDLENQLNKSNK